MKRHLAFFILCAAGGSAPLTTGCSGFAPPTPDQLEALGIADDAAPSPFTRCKFRMSVDSPWLTGEFDGVALATGLDRPVVRAQVFGDLGPKILDLSARPDRIAGYFPQTMDGVDCALPAEAAPHLLLFIGATLLEDLMPLRRSRIAGILAKEDGTWLRLDPVVPGLRTDVFKAQNGEIRKRRFTWMHGIRWEETRIAVDEWRITAPNLELRVMIVERDHAPPASLGALDLTLPDDVRLTQGSRK